MQKPLAHEGRKVQKPLAIEGKKVQKPLAIEGRKDIVPMDIGQPVAKSSKPKKRDIFAEIDKIVKKVDGKLLNPNVNDEINRFIASLALSLHALYVKSVPGR